MKIDSHHHFWKYDASEYAWIGEEQSVLQRDFWPRDLVPELIAAEIDGVVSVQARQTIEETETLLDYATNSNFIKGVVGWVPLVDPQVRDHLDRFATHPAFKAVRHVIQDEPANDFILESNFNRGIALLREFDLVYDILIYERHLPQTIQFIDRHPEQDFVLDHIGKPCIREQSFESWRETITKLSKRPNISCKLSGMVTEADHARWTEEQLQPYLDVILESFGPRRLMFGSDWPVFLLGCSCQRWVHIISRFVSQLSETEQA